MTRHGVRARLAALLAVAVVVSAACDATAPAPSASTPAPSAAPSAAPTRPAGAALQGDAPITVVGKEPVDSAPDESCAAPVADWAAGTVPRGSVVEGYASRDSATAGTDVDLYISTTAPRYRVEAYRMGYYGAGKPVACQVWQSAELSGAVQHRAVIVGRLYEATAPWRRSLTVPTTGWRPGTYLLRIDGGNPHLRSFIPLTIRSRRMAGRVVLVMPDTTWQAYNTWGGYSLYFGPSHQFFQRSRTVTFDRPYGYGSGAADFIGDDLPLVALAERIGIPLAYATDVDLQRDPAAFETARAVISVGHDEYYSPQMRDTLTAARDHGVNIGFLGANDIYRKIRFAPSRLGPNRQIINYKDASDPIGIPSLVTTQWRDAPSNDPESSLVGNVYQCASSTFYPIVVADSGNWMFAGTGATDGLALPGIAGHEFDGMSLTFPIPRPVDILFHSPVKCHGEPGHQDSTYYTTPSGAGVLDVGAYFWTCAIGNTCRIPIEPDSTRIITRMTTTFLTAAAAGPLGRSHPATDTVTRFYSTSGHAGTVAKAGPNG